MIVVDVLIILGVRYAHVGCCVNVVFCSFQENMRILEELSVPNCCIKIENIISALENIPYTERTLT